MMRIGAALLFIQTTLLADVLILKDGARVAGRVSDKATHYEVTVDGVLRTYLKEEVERVLATPKELLGGADQAYEAAKVDYQKALGLTDPSEQNTLLREAIAKVAQAREVYAAAYELFPEDAAIGRQIMLVMQLMRLLRERTMSEIARGGIAPRPSPTAPPPALPVDDALATLIDPAKRADPARRAGALASFRAQKTDLAVAAAMFLERDLKLEGEALIAVQEHFEKYLKGAPPLEAAMDLARRWPSLKGPAIEALFPFAAAHCSAAGPGPELEKAARAVGLVVLDGVAGTPEGHAVRDMNGWTANGDFDLAVLAFVKDHRAADTPSVRYVWSYALLRLVQSRKRGFDRPVGALQTVSLTGKPAQEHLTALVKSIKSAGVCNVCSGAGKLRCTNCHGQKETKFICQKCKGKGFTVSSLGAELVCGPCKKSGIERVLKCEKCKDGYTDCRQCEKEKSPPELEDILSMAPCGACEGRGLAFRRAAVPCRSCLGLGQKLIPKADPSKLLP